MVTNCCTCNGKITVKTPGLECSDCHKGYHAKCAKISLTNLRSLKSENAYWKCKACRQSSPNQLTIVEDGSGDDMDARGSDLTSILSGIEQLKENMITLNDKYDTVIQSVTFCSGKISDFEQALKKIGEKTKLIDKIMAENKELNTKISSLFARVDEMEQYSRLNNLEFANIPERTGENVASLFMNIGKAINCPITLLDLEVVHRVSHMPSTTNKSHPRNIIARFVSRRMKDEFLAAAKNFRLKLRQGSSGARVAGLNISGVADKLFINEHLSFKNKTLLRTTREAAVKKNYKFVWVTNCAIFARKDERSKVLVMRSMDDVARL
ncbi:l1 transposable element-related [Holotrichia oblita]|uniref:L1 transposable element-related n=1 Tax=Holotrichia oblita TaxID=644536 RepID=A0ACB9T8C7_HOLOL|nr:l1 transposable element-related [Holotrichia oblita]